jgi:hypothetical protein
MAVEEFLRDLVLKNDGIWVGMLELPFPETEKTIRRQLRNQAQLHRVGMRRKRAAEGNRVHLSPFI